MRGRGSVSDMALMVPHMDIGEAVKALKDGKHVSREGWNGQGMWLAYQLAAVRPHVRLVLGCSV
jgi:hypothetical protein